MPIFDPAVSQATVSQAAETVLFNLRRAFDAAENYYTWLSGVVDGDLSAIGFSATQISQLRSAMADAHQEHVLRIGGGLGTYTLPYNFAASQNIIIGPAT